MSLADACKKAVQDKMSKVGSGDSLAQVCQDAIIQGLQPLINELESLSNMIGSLKDSLGKIGENGEKGVLTDALVKIHELKGDVQGLSKTSHPSFTEEGSFGKSKDAFMNRKVMDDEIRRCRDNLIVTFEAGSSKIGDKITGDLVRALNVEKKRLPGDLKNLKDENDEIKIFTGKDIKWDRLRSPRAGKKSDKSVFRLRISGQYGKRCLYQALKQGGEKFAGIQVRPEVPVYLRDAQKMGEKLSFFIRKQQTGIRTKTSFNAAKNGIEVHIGHKNEGRQVKFVKVSATFQEEGCLRLEEDMTEDDLKSMAASCIEKLDSTVEQ